MRIDVPWPPLLAAGAILGFRWLAPAALQPHTALSHLGAVLFYMAVFSFTAEEATHVAWALPALVAAAMARFTDSSIGMQPFACMAILHLLAHITLRWLRRDDGSLSHHRAILVTGAGSGIGRALCEVLLLRGDSIVAVDADVDALARLHRWHCQQGATYARDEHFIPPERRRGSKFLSSPIKCGYTIDYGVDPDDPPNHKSNLLSIPCDVSDAASVADAVKTLKIQWPSRASQWGLQHADDEGRGEIQGFHAIVHLAGVFGCGPLAEAPTVDAVRRTLDVNVMGTVRITQAFYPLLCKKTQASAHLRQRAEPLDTTPNRIIVVGSEVSAARMATGLTAPYAMSKFALDAYATALRQEVAAVNAPPTRVCMVYPGPIQTPLSTRATEQAALAHVRAESRWSAGLLALVSSAKAYVGARGIEPSHAARAIAAIVHAIEPPRSTTINYTLEMRMAAFTPQWLLDLVADKLLRGA